GDPKVLWRTKVGEGHSSPLVADGVVYLHDLTKDGDKNVERLTAFDAASGKAIGEVRHERGPFASIFGVGPRATPGVPGGAIYALGVTGRFSREASARSAGGAIAFKTAYSIDALKEFGASNLVFGVSASPLVDGDYVLLAVGLGDKAPVVALNKETGKVAW